MEIKNPHRKLIKIFIPLFSLFVLLTLFPFIKAKAQGNGPGCHCDPEYCREGLECVYNRCLAPVHTPCSDNYDCSVSPGCDAYNIMGCARNQFKGGQECLGRHYYPCSSCEDCAPGFFCTSEGYCAKMGERRCSPDGSAVEERECEDSRDCRCTNWTEWYQVQYCGTPEWSNEYRCLGNIVQRKYIDRGCRNGECYFLEIWYDWENCDKYDGWYDTGNKRWVSGGDCKEKEQKEQVYRDYSCSNATCTFTTTTTRWIDTGATRNLPDGTPCSDDGNPCTKDYCYTGKCIHPFYCSGTDDNCGCTSCINCNERDGCVGPDYHDYYCSGYSCTSTIIRNDPRCCSDECSPSGATITQCSGNWVQIRICGNYDDDPCLEWSSWKDYQYCGTPEWSNEYRCLGNIVQRKYIDRGCRNGECYFLEIWYDWENCDRYDGWYDTGNKRWVSGGDCKEKEQKEQVYRDYSCSNATCTFTTTTTRWIDTGATRNLPDGTPCFDDGDYCTRDFCVEGVCTHPRKTLEDTCGDGECNCGEDYFTCPKDSCPPPNFPPTATDLNASQGDYCVIRFPHVFLSWKFIDLNPTDSQSAYQIQIDTDDKFDPPLIHDTQKINSNSQSYSPPPQTLSFTTRYYWRLRVWDSQDAVSDWILGPTFTTPRHSYPFPNFDWAPEKPNVGSETNFFDRSICYDDRSEGSDCDSQNGKIDKFFWTFEGAIPNSSFKENPSTTFISFGEKKVTLKVTDSDNFSCGTSTTLVPRILYLPIFREIPPR